jgi:hypothetical protein
MNIMNIIELARQAGINAEADTLCRYDGWVEPLEAFAKLVVANIDPKSFMSWQEGYAAGTAQEREACAKVCEKHGYDHFCGNVTDKIAETIRERGQA